MLEQPYRTQPDYTASLQIFCNGYSYFKDRRACTFGTHNNLSQIIEINKNLHYAKYLTLEFNYLL
jgi:hypothetical protein